LVYAFFLLSGPRCSCSKHFAIWYKMLCDLLSSWSSFDRSADSHGPQVFVKNGLCKSYNYKSVITISLGFCIKILAKRKILSSEDFGFCNFSFAYLFKKSPFNEYINYEKKTKMNNPISKSTTQQV